MLKTSIGLKAVMAVTGLVLFGFVVGHMLGNLQIFLGRDVLNDYAQKLHDMGALLWAARLFLLVVLVIHVSTAFRLTAANREARPVRYFKEDTVAASYASRTMMMSGIIILLFLLYHLAHFTLQWVGLPDATFVEELPDGKTRSDVFAIVVAGFSIWYVSGLYILAQLFLGLHLSHGVSSLFQTLGANWPRYQTFFRYIGPVSAIVIVAGNIAIPLAVLTGFIRSVAS